MVTLCEITYRGVTAVHYVQSGKYMIWYHKKGDPMKTVGIVQVRGLKGALTEKELETHIDKLWEGYYKEKEHNAEKRAGKVIFGSD